MTIALLFFLLQKIFSKRIAIFGAFLAALGPFTVRYSDEARMYALAALLSVSATYAFIMAVDKKTKNPGGYYTDFSGNWHLHAVFPGVATSAHFVYLWLKIGGDRTDIINFY